MSNQPIEIVEPKPRRIRLLMRRPLSQGAQQRLLTMIDEHYANQRRRNCFGAILRPIIEAVSNEALTISVDEIRLESDEVPLFVVTPIEDLADEIRALTARLGMNPPLDLGSDVH